MEPHLTRGGILPLDYLKKLYNDKNSKNRIYEMIDGKSVKMCSQRYVVYKFQPSYQKYCRKLRLCINGMIGR